MTSTLRNRSVARMVRPYASWDGLHLEMLTALIILVTGTLALLISHTRHATRELRACVSTASPRRCLSGDNTPDLI